MIAIISFPFFFFFCLSFSLASEWQTSSPEPFSQIVIKSTTVNQQNKDGKNAPQIFQFDLSIKTPRITIRARGPTDEHILMGEIDERPAKIYSVRLTKGVFKPAFERLGRQAPVRPARQFYAY